MSRAESHPWRVGIPYRTLSEERNDQREKIEPYHRAIRDAGADPVPISLGLGEKLLREVAVTLDAVLLPGSPADVDPARYGAPKSPKCAERDEDRERTDFTLIELALGEGKPVLAICYGIQSLNVFFGGTLVQDIPSERPSEIRHQRRKGAPERFHSVQVEPGTQLAAMYGAGENRVNSSHHQCIRDLGRQLRISARSSDGLIEGVEGTDAGAWLIGVQWHPERLAPSDPAARSLFQAFVKAAARNAPARL